MARFPRFLRLVLFGGVIVVVAYGLLYWHEVRTAPLRAAAAEVRRIESELAQLHAAVQEAPTRPEPRWALASYYHQLGVLDRAATELKALLELQPDRENVCVLLGTLQLALQQYPESETTFRQATEKWPQRDRHWQSLSVSLFHQQRYLEAVWAGREAVKLDEEEPNNRFVLASALVEYARQFPTWARHVDAFDNAAVHLRTILAVWPDNADVYYRLGRAYMGLQDGNNAVRMLRRGRELMPNRPSMVEDLAYALLQVSARDEARQLVTECLEEWPDAAVFHDLMGELTESGSGGSEAALAHFQKAVQLAPENPFFLEHLGSTYLRQGNLEAARDAFERVVAVDEHRALPYQQLAAIYTRLGDARKASALAREATGHVFNDQQLQQVETVSASNPDDLNLRLILADRYRGLGLENAARDEYLWVGEKDPGNARAAAGLKALRKGETALDTERP